MPNVRIDGLYLDRVGHTVGIKHDRGEGQVWRWLTTRGYYVHADGRAAHVGNCAQDLVIDITPTQAQCDGVDSTMGNL